jgi:hypothetical protein
MDEPQVGSVWKKNPAKNVWRDKARAAERECGVIFRRFVDAVNALGDDTVSAINDD